MSAMRKRVVGSFLTAILFFSLLTPTSASALFFNSIPGKWGQILASDKQAPLLKSNPRPTKLEGEVKSEWKVNYKNFPANAQAAAQYAIDIWSRSFTSTVPISIEATWEPNKNDQILGSARAGYYFNSFPGAPDEDLWYPSALANTLAGKDLDPKQSEILLNINSNAEWYLGIDGKPTFGDYDLASVVLHEIAHGLGFMSNAQYDRFAGVGYISQPTPFDAYVQLPDGRTFTNFCSRSSDLGRAMINPLFWSGELAISANKGTKPKLYTPSPFEEGSSIAHLDETTYDKRFADSVMTPNMDQGEVFQAPGPIALAMIEDMLRKPPAGIATGIPSKPLNVSAVIGDKYALLTFDSPECSRVDKVKNYKVTINPTGETRSFRNTPFRITGLKNGTTYSFSLVAENELGTSEPVISNSIKPQLTPNPIRIDTTADVEHLEATSYQGKPTIIYGDLSTQTLKMAVRSNNKWKISTIRKALQVGAISICKKGSGTKEELHVFYGEVQRQDLLHSTFVKGRWNHETVDGNGVDVQDYKESERRRTASDVSISNACSITDDGIQVFYRDETQGILLGAVKDGEDWRYEIVDGDRDTDSRTTGDVAFDLAASTVGNTTYLIYDSVLTIDTNRTVTSGAVRLAVRQSAEFDDWEYETLDGPQSGSAVAGFAVGINVEKDSVTAAWLVAKGNYVSRPSQVSYVDVTNEGAVFSITPTNFGVLGSPLTLNQGVASFACDKRLCAADQDFSRVKLLSKEFPALDTGKVISFNKKRYLVTSINKELLLIRI